MASSSDAVQMLINAHVLVDENLVSLGALTWMESRLEDSDSVVLRDRVHQQLAFIKECKQHCIYRAISSPLEGGRSQRTFNMCNSVVFPALSKPRKRSFACLFKSPSDARVSQTGRGINISFQSKRVLLLPFENFNSYLHQFMIHILATRISEVRLGIKRCSKGCM